ncbi:hypothetical protein [Turicibacter sanguinis]|uniref:hypothetical protein n=1 Tax=Turicibacter sanguinis TaxID=154288 RepID=UPI00241C271F|nr:hypothetical protein [Turicibacter sanguinis]
MLRINRIKIVVNTAEGIFGFDHKFDKKINFIASYKNTRGKSSAIEAIYYCLALEELIGGKGEKSLKPVFRDSLIYDDREVKVLESEFYLEVIEGNDSIKTIYRTACKQYYSSNLIRVYSGDIDSAIKDKCPYEDGYVHSPGAATKERGFYTILEEILGFKLPKVPSYDDVERKLYLQIIFSAMFVEQKRGWSGLFATTPTYLRVRDPQKRTIEYMLGLESLEIEEKRQRCKDNEASIKKEWELVFNNINIILNQQLCLIESINSKPEILNEDSELLIFKILDDGKKMAINDYIVELENRLKEIDEKSSYIGPNIGDLESKLYAKQDELLKLEERLLEEKQKNAYEKKNKNSLCESLEIICLDLENNKDILKIKKMGSNQSWKITNGICPTCNQQIQDVLLPQNENIKVMSIEDNIRHLEAQKSMIEFSIKSSENSIAITEGNIQILEKKITEYRRILRAIKSDLYSVEKEISETVIREKILIKNSIETLNELISQCGRLFGKLKVLSKEWQLNLETKACLPQSNLSEDDKYKVKVLKDNFIKNLKLFGYKSLSDISKVEISDDKLMPIINGFDIKFDSSASDNIRVIWAFTLSLMQTSISVGGRHPKILIFDEPGQQSMIVADLCNFIKELCKLDDDTQTIIGITLDDINIKSTIEQLDSNISNLILIEDKSISLLKSN